MKKLFYLVLYISLINCSYAQLCKGVKKEYDKFEKSTSYDLTIMMPVTKAPSIYSIYISKDSSEINVQYLLTINIEVTPTDYVRGRKGVVMLFSNGKEYRNSYASASISLPPSKRLSATLPIDKKDLLVLLKSSLTDLRLGYVDIVVSTSTAKLINEGVECIINAQ